MNRKSSAGAFTITGRGIDTSSMTLGAAISKAQTLAVRMQLAGELQQEDTQSIYIRPIGGDTVARIDVEHDVVKTYVSR